MPIQSKIPVAARYDYVEWETIKMYIGALTLVPIRAFTLFYIVFLSLFWTKAVWQLAGKGTYKDEQSELYAQLNKFMGLFVKTLMYPVLGINFTRKYHRISDYLADYKGFELDRETKCPIVISNHVTAVDIIIYLGLPRCPSFIANINIKNVPFVGPICTLIQSIYVSRNATAESKNDIIDGMSHRVQQIKKGHNFPGILVFPEGTTNNGLELMTFKRGAFVHNCPIKIYGLQLEQKGVQICLCMVNEWEFLFLQLSNLTHNVNFHEFEPFNPEYCNHKYQLKENEENNWKYISDDIRYLYEYVGGMMNSGDWTFSKKREYEYKVKDSLSYKIKVS